MLGFTLGCLRLGGCVAAVGVGVAADLLKHCGARGAVLGGPVLAGAVVDGDAPAIALRERQPAGEGAPGGLRVAGLRPRARLQ